VKLRSVNSSWCFLKGFIAERDGELVNQFGFALIKVHLAF
jgi:hypothetical protein